MLRADINAILEPIDRLHQEIIDFIPQDVKYLQFRSDLTGLLVVTMAASYENCVKETLIAYCGSHSPIFGAFAANQYEKLNSRINLGDLKNYVRLFGPAKLDGFKVTLADRRSRILSRTGKDICGLYDQILGWRHQYAHAGQQNTTIEEAYASHTFAKRVLFTFADSLL